MIKNNTPPLVPWTTDTSDSISDKELEAFLEEAKGVQGATLKETADKLSHLFNAFPFLQDMGVFVSFANDWAKNDNGTMAMTPVITIGTNDEGPENYIGCVPILQVIEETGCIPVHCELLSDDEQILLTLDDADDLRNAIVSAYTESE